MFPSLLQIPFRRVALDELPQHSPWPERLLGLSPFAVSEKTPAEVIREFGRDKWGETLRRVEQAGSLVPMATVESWEFGDAEELLCSLGDEIGFVAQATARSSVLDVFATTIERYFPASALVELGAGYGHKILSLGSRPSFSDTTLIAGELTASGRSLMQLMANSSGMGLRIIQADLASRTISSEALPADAVIFTSYAAHYVAEYTQEMLLALAQFRPRAIVHFEPIYDHCRGGSLLGLMRRRYIEVNGYNRNLLPTIRSLAADGRLEILEEIPAVFGLNPLLPFSVIAWRPVAAS